MELDRAYQRDILRQLADAYPEQVNIEDGGVTGQKATINLWYLDQHGLVEALKAEYIGAPPAVHAARITHRGLDFLADDGGLSAILGTVTVRLHADTIRDLIEARIAQAEIPSAEKKRIIDHLRSLPEEALKHLTKRLLDEALDRMPDAVHWLQKWLGS